MLLHEAFLRAEAKYKEGHKAEKQRQSQTSWRMCRRLYQLRARLCSCYGLSICPPMGSRTQAYW